MSGSEAPLRRVLIIVGENTLGNSSYAVLDAAGSKIDASKDRIEIAFYYSLEPSRSGRSVVEELDGVLTRLYDFFDGFVVLQERTISSSKPPHLSDLIRARSKPLVLVTGAISPDSIDDIIEGARLAATRRLWRTNKGGNSNVMVLI